MTSLGRFATLLLLMTFFACRDGVAGGEVGAGGSGGAVGAGGTGGEVGTGGTGGEVGSGGSGGQPVEVAIEIEPASRRARQGETVQFTATVTGSDETAVTWSATGGEISAEGLFTAPEVPGVSTVVATAVADPTKSASATVEVPVATGLSYADPATEGWRLVKNVGASTPDRLVLDLVGPEGESGRGVELVLATEPAESVWAQVDPDTDRVRNIAFDLGPEPRLLAAHEAGGTLRAGVFQKGDSAPPAAYTGPLVSVALELASGATVASGTPLVLGVERASELPGVGSLRPVHVEIGALAAE